MFILRAIRSCLVLQFQSAEVSRTVTSSFEWSWTISVNVNLLAQELFFLILAHTVNKMWIIQEPNKLELWNKLHFKEKKTESIHHV